MTNTVQYSGIILGLLCSKQENKAHFRNGN